jgi:hypothetical protein
MACGCQQSGLETCSHCEFEPFVRNNYFTGKLMGAADFIADQSYHAEKLRHHNARLHGSGVVCGLGVHQHPNEDCRPRYVVIEPGSALDCCGHEILVTDEEILDVAHHPSVVDRANDGRLHTLQVVACYRECPTEEVPVLYDDCGCDDTQCAANRILESYAFDILVDPPLRDGLGCGATALGAFVTTDLHGAAGWVRAGAAGRLAIVDPGDDVTQPADSGRRLLLLDVAHRSLVAVDLPATARAVAMSADGNHAFVVVNPVGAASECGVLVFATADGTEVVPGTPRTIPGSSAASTFSAVATSAADRALIVLDGSSGDLHPWPVDSATVIKDAAGTAIPFVKGGSITAADDGSRAYAIDSAGTVQALDLTAAAPAAAPVAGLPATAKPTALATLVAGTTTLLAVASGPTRSVEIVDFATPPTRRSVVLEHPPLLLGVTGPATAPWIEVYEEEAGHAYFQAIAVDPGNPPAAPLATAARAAGDGPRRVIIANADGQASVVDTAAFAAGDCSDLVCAQSACPSCDGTECVVLATISGYRPGASLLDPGTVANAGTTVARIDPRAGRRIVASTATLQAWLECLQLKGGIPGPKGDQGPQGDPGPGIKRVEVETGECGSDATATLVDGVLTLTVPRGCDGDPGGGGLVEVSLQMGDCDTPPKAELVDGRLELVIPSCCNADLARICGINWPHARQVSPDQKDLVISFTKPIDVSPESPFKHLFIVETNLPQDGQDKELGVECWCQVTGAYIPLQFGDPCKQQDEKDADPYNAIRFVPDRGFQPGRDYRVRLLGDLIRDRENGRAIDANNLPPWHPSEIRPTGDCIEGGTFFSFFTVKG